MKLVGLAITLSLAAPLAAAASLQIRQQWDDLPDCFRICFGQAVTNNVCQPYSLATTVC